MTDNEFHRRLKTALKRHLTIDVGIREVDFGDGQDYRFVIVRYDGEEIDTIDLDLD